MPDMTCAMIVHTVDDETSIIDVQGALTGAGVRELAAAYARASGSRTRTVVLNLHGLEFMSSSGICLLVRLLVWADQRAQRVLAFGLNEHFRDVFGSTRLDEVIGVFEDEAHALAAAAVPRPKGRGSTGNAPRRVGRFPLRGRVRHGPAFWAKRVSVLRVSNKVPADAARLNVHGRRVVGPMQGFGKMWRKSYRIDLNRAHLPPAEVINIWKANFPDFWPSGNRFFRPKMGIAPGEVALISLDLPGPVELSTGVLVLYADAESFTLMTPQGHVFAGWISFSASEEGDRTVAQAEVLMRASDPLYELGMGLLGHRQEDAFWAATLRSLAAHLGVEGDVETRTECIDPRRQWSRAGNIWHNAAIRSGFYVLTLPLLGPARQLRRATIRLVGENA